MQMTISQVEENYLKAIFKIVEREDKPASTNGISAIMQTTAASVTDMLKRLSEKQLIQYEKYKGVQLTDSGNRIATALIRKHRLWEVFLMQKLGFAWDQVHDFAEQLEHIQGDALVERLDHFLGRPKFDPHGDPIPDAEGRWARRPQIRMASMAEGTAGVVTGVEDHSAAFLQYLDKVGIALGTSILIVERIEYDQSLRIVIQNKETVLSEKAAQNIFLML